jgi:sugar phosphate permease
MNATVPPIRHSRIIKATPIYYGWIILIAASLGLMMTMPGQTVSVSVFLDSIIEELGITRTAISLMYTVATLGGSLALPFVGRVIDQRGPRLTVIVVAGALALACVYMGFIQGLVMLFLGLMMIRSLGQGSLSLVSQHVINLWFVRRRGLALGLSGLGFAIGTALFPLLINALIDNFGWRSAYMLIGGLVALTILPLGALFYRGHPEAYGLLPDGGSQQVSAPLTERHFTLAEARRTPTFWLFVAGGVSVSALSTALIFHNYDLLAAQGLARELATQVFVPVGFVSFFANLLTGYLVDKFPPRFILSVAQGLLAAVMVLVLVVNTLPLIYAYGVLLGVMQGMSGMLSASVYAHYFGRRHLGEIKGMVTTILVAGTAIGPVLFSLGKDIFGGYQQPVMVLTLIPVAIAVAALFVKPPTLLSPTRAS